MKRAITSLIGLLLILFYCASCGIIKGDDNRKANRHLRKANRHLRKAELLGAVWSKDTLFKKLQFTVPGINVKFTPKILTVGKPMIFIKDSVRTEVLIVKGKNGVDTVYVDTKCPDTIIAKEIPVAINNSIKAGLSFWQKAGIFSLVFIIGVVTGIWIRAGPASKFTISLKNEKPPE